MAEKICEQRIKIKSTALLLILCPILMIGCASQKQAVSPTLSSVINSTLTSTTSLAYPTLIEFAYPMAVDQGNPTAFYPPPAPDSISTPYPTQPPVPSATPTLTETPSPTPEPLPSVQPEQLYQVLEQGNISAWYSGCIQSGQPEKPIFVKGLDGAPDTYHLAYRKDGKFCLVAVVGYQAGIWTVRMHTADYKGTSYPPIRAEDASAYIEKMICQKTKGQPVLGGDIYGHAAWRVTSADGTNYDVFSVFGQTETNTRSGLIVWAIKQGDDLRNWLQSSTSCFPN